MDADEALRQMRQIEESIESLGRNKSELDSIRADILVNFGRGMRHNVYGFSIPDEESTERMVLAVMKRLSEIVKACQVFEKDLPFIEYIIKSTYQCRCEPEVGAAPCEGCAMVRLAAHARDVLSVVNGGKS